MTLLLLGHWCKQHSLRPGCKLARENIDLHELQKFFHHPTSYIESFSKNRQGDLSHFHIKKSLFTKCPDDISNIESSHYFHKCIYVLWTVLQPSYLATGGMHHCSIAYEQRSKTCRCLSYERITQGCIQTNIPSHCRAFFKSLLTEAAM